MPTLTIDGRPITIEPGATILDAARSAGIDIPTLCWYPELPVVGNCRVCLVSVEGAPKLTAACATLARGDILVANLLDPDVGVLCTRSSRGIECTKGEVLDSRIAESGSRRECRRRSRRGRRR